MKGILGRKVGMTQLFSEQGKLIPVTLVEVKPNVVTKVLTKENNGYVALQLGVEDKKTTRSNKPELGHAKKAKTTPKRFVKEIRGMEGYELGTILNASIFETGDLVDIQGTSKGHGFSGAIKRHNQSIGPKSHGGGGGSQPQRQTGSLGDISGNKVVKGMTMPGQYGNVTTTIQNLEVVSIDLDNNIILIKGSIPGPKKSFVVIKESIKGLSKREPLKLIDFNIVIRKNKLLEESKKLGIDNNPEISIEELEISIKNAKDKLKKDEKAKKEDAKTKPLVETKEEKEDAKTKPLVETKEEKEDAKTKPLVETKEEKGDANGGK
ncbi:MAG: 50S ribosomal protein L3 [Mycoplasma sp.]|nr:50S ribosomal protein L3 [Mycoplasma sp.]